MCSPWGTPLCCSGTRRRFSVLGKSGGGKTETSIKGKGGNTSTWRFRGARLFKLGWNVKLLVLKQLFLLPQAFLQPEWAAAQNLRWDEHKNPAVGKWKSLQDWMKGKWRQRRLPLMLQWSLTSSTDSNTLTTKCIKCTKYFCLWSLNNNIELFLQALRV